MLLPAGYFAHGLWDLAHHRHGPLADILGWWVPYCVIYDWLVGAFLVFWGGDGMRLSEFLAGQLRKPSGWFGRLVMGRFFNKVNDHINQLTIERLNIQSTDHVLDIGFGGGFTIPRMATLAHAGKVCGVDFSEAMVRQAERRFHRLIEQGKVEVRLGDLASLPYKDGAFDKVCTVNTLYFWPNPVQNLAEIRRVMKHDGRLVVAFRSREKMKPMRKFLHDLRLYSPNEVRELLEQAGFRNVRLEKYDEDKRLDAILAIGSARAAL